MKVKKAFPWIKILICLLIALVIRSVYKDPVKVLLITNKVKYFKMFILKCLFLNVLERIYYDKNLQNIYVKNMFLLLK